MRVRITDLRSGDRLAQDIFNRHGMHVLSKGALLDDHELELLSRHQIDEVEIERRTAAAPRAVPAEPVEPDPLSPPHLSTLYQDAVTGFVHMFHKALVEGRVYEEDLEASFQPLLERFKFEHDVVSLLLMLNSQDDYTYEHSVQVGMLCYYIARWLGWDEEQQVMAGKAGFLHDIGKCRISDAILNKPGKLTDQEYKEIQNHSVYGYEILHHSFEDPTLALTALQHHERMDGRGYPQGLRADRIHPLAKIVAVADIYSAMISTRVYQQKKDLLYVLRELYQLSFRELDPLVTHTFITHMVPNFIGKQTELSDGSIGVIVFMNPADHFGPLVQVEDRFIDLSRERQYQIVRIFM